LQRLCTDCIGLYQIHLFDKETPLEKTLGALNDVVRAGVGLRGAGSQRPNSSIHIQSADITSFMRV
jgi:aryl-alcohol dehydrogenase-like predicted oxidoreductase